MSSPQFALPSELRINDVERLYAAMSEFELASDGISIDANGVEKIDFCGLQLVLAFVGRIKREGLGVSWDGVSETFMTAVNDAQLHKKLGLHDS